MVCVTTIFEIRIDRLSGVNARRPQFVGVKIGWHYCLFDDVFGKFNAVNYNTQLTELFKRMRHLLAMFPFFHLEIGASR